METAILAFLAILALAVFLMLYLILGTIQHAVTTFSQPQLFDPRPQPVVDPRPHAEATPAPKRSRGRPKKVPALPGEPTTHGLTPIAEADPRQLKIDGAA